MKKMLAALLIAVLMLPCLALAEDLLSADPAEVMTFDRESHVTGWVGNWSLIGAYIGEEYAEEYEVSTSGMLPVTAGAITVTLTVEEDASANDKQLGTMVDVASYIHAHVHDLAGVMTFAADIGDAEEYTIKSAWDEWPNNVVRGENDGDFNYGPARTHVRGEDETLHWATITGVEIEDMDEMKYIGVNTADQLIICYADDNVAKKDGEVGFAYIFERVVE